MTPEDALTLLGPDGEARRHFKASNGEWVDGFFDKICTLLARTPLEDLTLEYGAKSANVVTNQNGDVQLNVRWSDDTGWACYTAPTLDEAMGQMWMQINMVNTLRETSNGLPPEQR